MSSVFRCPLLFCGLLMACLDAEFVTTIQAKAQAPHASPIAFERGKWIEPSDAEERDASIFHFRRIISVPSAPEHLRIRVTADAHFLLYVNGKFAGEGPARSDPQNWKYEIIDVGPLLSPGENVIAAVVWSFGRSTPVATLSVRTAFLLESEDKDWHALDTNKDWEVEPATGREPIRLAYSKVLRGYYAAAPGERIDGRSYDWNFDTKDTLGAWKPAHVLGTPTVDGVEDGVLFWRLTPDLLPALEHTPTSIGRIVRTDSSLDFRQVPFVVPPHTHVRVLFDRGTLTTAYPEITLAGGQGASVRVTYAEALVDMNGNKGNRNEVSGRHIAGVYDEFLLAGVSEHTYAPLDWRTWRYLELEISTVDSELHVNDARATFTAFPFRLTAEFETSDPMLRDIWETSWRTARLDAHDTYMDTPYWERLQYAGDTRLQALISYAMTGDDRLARQAIDALDHSRLSFGLTQSRYPSNLAQIIPPFSLLWIGMLHDFWLYRDDPIFVRAHLPGVESTLTWFLNHQRQDSLLNRLPWWAFADWTEGFENGEPPQDADGGSALLTLQFIEALRNAADLERAFGRKKNAMLFSAASSRAAATLRAKCWNRQRGLLADTPAKTHFSQQTNALAVWLGVVAPADATRVVRNFLAFDAPDFARSHPDLHYSTASYYFRFYVARALEAAGLGGDYLETLQPWRDMLALGLSTWAERPEPTRSDSHAWSAHPAFDLLRIVAGIRPKTSNFSKVMIEPHPATLSSFTARYPHPKGAIVVQYAHGDFTITLPQNLTGTFRWRGRDYALLPGTQAPLHRIASRTSERARKKP